jgi:hypothetical protein
MVAASKFLSVAEEGTNGCTPATPRRCDMVKVGMRAMMNSPPASNTHEETTPKELIAAWSKRLLTTPWQREHLHRVLTNHITSKAYAVCRANTKGAGIGQWMDVKSQLQLCQDLGIDMTGKTLAAAWVVARNRFYHPHYAEQEQLWGAKAKGDLRSNGGSLGDEGAGDQ